jgi:transposase
MLPIVKKDEAIELRIKGLTYKEIGQKMNISLNSAKSLCSYTLKTLKKKRGPKPKITKKLQFRIKRQISFSLNKGERVTSSKIMKECEINANVRTVQKYLRKEGYKYKKARKEIVLTKKHMQNRVSHITSWFEKCHDWESTIFSDEKRFCLDGPDDWRSYVSKSNTIIHEKRQCSGGGIMVWMMLMPNGLLAHRIIIGKFNSSRYIELLENMIVPIIKLNYRSNFTFQEDNCSVHKAKSVKSFMNLSNIRVLDWPSKSPDLNIVEDVWRMISNKVYDGPQFRNNKDLILKINTVILELCDSKREILQELYTQIRKRLCKVLQSKGGLYNKIKT